MGDFRARADHRTIKMSAPPSVYGYNPLHTRWLAERNRWLRSHGQGCWPWKTTDSGKEAKCYIWPQSNRLQDFNETRAHANTHIPEQIGYLVQPKGALRIIEENQSLVTETNYPLAAVQIWQSKQLFAEHGRQASSGEAQREPAVRDDGFLSPRCHQLGQHRTELRWGGEDHDSSASHERAIWLE